MNTYLKHLQLQYKQQLVQVRQKLQQVMPFFYLIFSNQLNISHP